MMARWTEREDALLRQLRASGEPLSKIAPKLPHRTREAVSTRIQILIRQGQIERRLLAPVDRRPWTRREDALLVRMRSRGATAADIADRLPARSSRAIEIRMSRLLDAGTVVRRGPKSRRPWSSIDDRRLEQLREAGKTMPEIARVLRRSLPSINGRIAVMVRNGSLPLLERARDRRRPD